jgi:hypothetical protein
VLAPPDLLALRPVATVHHLPRNSEACPLSLRDLVRALARTPASIPVIAAPLVAVARGALVAASQANAVVGLMPAGAPVELWFEAVAQAAHELAPRRPFFVSSVVRVDEGDPGGSMALADAYRLVEAGVTHLAVDVTALPLARRAQAAAQTASFAAERELAVDCVLPSDPECPLVAAEACAFVEEFEGWGVRADLVSVWMPAPEDAAQAASQLAALAEVGREVGDRPVVRRGPCSAALVSRLRGSGLRACEDGGMTLASCLKALPAELREPPGAGRRALWRIPERLAERLEALAYEDVAALIDSAGAGGTAEAARAALAPGLRR